MSLVPLVRCTQPVPCGHCWYCERWHAQHPVRRWAVVREATGEYTVTFDPWIAGWRYFHAQREAQKR